jgi:hypothetical protein
VVKGFVDFRRNLFSTEVLSYSNSLKVVIVCDEVGRLTSVDIHETLTGY